MSLVCLKEAVLCIFGVRSPFWSYQRDGYDIKATRRYCDRFASKAKTDDNHEQLLKESIIHAGQKMHIKMQPVVYRNEITSFQPLFQMQPVV